jgi:hypothetical protein
VFPGQPSIGVVQYRQSDTTCVQTLMLSAFAAAPRTRARSNWPASVRLRIVSRLKLSVLTFFLFMVRSFGECQQFRQRIHLAQAAGASRLLADRVASCGSGVPAAVS